MVREAVGCHPPPYHRLSPTPAWICIPLVCDREMVSQVSPLGHAACASPDSLRLTTSRVPTIGAVNACCHEASRSHADAWSMSPVMRIGMRKYATLRWFADLRLTS